MSRIAARFAMRRASGGAALVAYVTAGDPALDESAGVVRAIAAAGADVIELGVPWTDPSADGPAIQAAMQRALAGGATLATTLDLVRRVRDEGVEAPIVLFGYYNPILQRGAARLAREAAAAGVDGLLVVDLPPEEADELRLPAVAAGLDLIALVAPTSTPARVALATRAATGFVYYVSLTGVTGAGHLDLASVELRVRALRERLAVPLAVGFGVADVETARRVAVFAEGVVVGSAFVRAIEAACARGESPAVAAGELAAALASALHEPLIRR